MRTSKLILFKFILSPPKYVSYFGMDFLTRKLNLLYLGFQFAKFIATRYCCSRKRLLPLAQEHNVSREKNLKNYCKSVLVEKDFIMKQKDLKQGSSKHNIDQSTVSSPNKKLKTRHNPPASAIEEKRRPNYFVAVQITDSKVHNGIKSVQEHILNQDDRYKNTMISLPTLHITLMVMYLADSEAHKRAMIALSNVHKENNDALCQDPLILEFEGLGNFRNTVLFAKIKKNESYRRLSELAENVQKHFADVEIFSTNQRREFNPHLTIAKIDFGSKKRKGFNKIDPCLYQELIKENLGSDIIKSIQLLSMNKPKTESGYYQGNELLFAPCDAKCSAKDVLNTHEIGKKKQDLKKSISELMQKTFK